ncbi:10007_t:CDS:2 [Paraglomus occultum]|uniref:10007_t:CDS:1 n=1 Tax=Paraglomus occultum TaxID=144539 RepID=A0A9N9DZG4_9GLOM|nr:10007_t:CDS:2 [Paraglomus occultum]
MDPMDVDTRVMSEGEFCMEYGRKNPEATYEKARGEYHHLLNCQLNWLLATCIMMMMSSYPVEPILAEAAARLTQIISMRDLLRHLLTAIRSVQFVMQQKREQELEDDRDGLSMAIFFSQSDIKNLANAKVLFTSFAYIMQRRSTSIFTSQYNNMQTKSEEY